MRKMIQYLLLFVFSISIFFVGTNNIYAAGASLTGPGSARAGDTITVYLNVSDPGKFGIEGSIAYDGGLVTLQGVAANVGGWKYESNGASFVLYDDQLTNPLGDGATVLVLTFRINDGVAAGTTINISVNNILTTDGSTENNLGTAAYSLTVAPPLSGNNNLASLSVNEGTLSPSFSARTTSYSLGEVDYSVSKLNISAVPEDGKSSISISGTNLSVGNNTVTIAVTAENGATKTYKITVTRKQDPNYIPSSDASLKDMEVSRGTISPLFSRDVFSYIVYLPYEMLGSEFTASGTAFDSKSQGVSKGSIKALAEGVNTTTITCTAEDGSTTQTYTIHVIVMPPFAGVIPLIEGVDTVEVEFPDGGVDDTEMVESTQVTTPQEEPDGANSLGSGWMFFVGLIVGAVGSMTGWYVYRKYFKTTL